MAAQIPTNEPETIIAGDTAQWTKRLDDYSVTAGWVLTYYLVLSTGGNPITFPSSGVGSDGSSFAISIPASTTKGWPPGEYQMQGRVSLAGEVHTVWRGIIHIERGFSANPGDIRSDAKIIYDNITAVLKKTATREVLSSKVAGVELQRYPIADLLKLRDRFYQIWQNEVVAERIAAGLGTGRKILTRFCKPQPTLPPNRLIP